MPDVTSTGIARCIRHLAIRTPAVIRAAIITGGVTPVFYFVILGFGLGSVIDRNDASAVGGNYLQFVGSGLLATAAIEWAFREGLWPTSTLLRWERTYDGMANTPTTIDEIATSHMLWLVLRMVGAAVLFTGVLFAFGAAESWWALTGPLVAGLTCLAVAGWVTGFVAADDQDVHYPLVLRMGMFPMVIFSGAFFPLDGVPAAAAFIARLFPAYHGVELSRAVNSGEFAGVGGHLAYLAVLAIAGWAFQLHYFRGVLRGERP